MEVSGNIWHWLGFCWNVDDNVCVTTFHIGATTDTPCVQEIADCAAAEISTRCAKNRGREHPHGAMQ